MATKYDNEMTGALFTYGEDMLGTFELNGEKREARFTADGTLGIYDDEGNLLAGGRLTLPNRGAKAPTKFEFVIIARKGVIRERMVAFASSNEKHEFFVQIRRDAMKPITQDPALAALLKKQ